MVGSASIWPQNLEIWWKISPTTLLWTLECVHVDFLRNPHHQIRTRSELFATGLAGPILVKPGFGSMSPRKTATHRVHQIVLSPDPENLTSSDFLDWPRSGEYCPALLVHGRDGTVGLAESLARVIAAIRITSIHSLVVISPSKMRKLVLP